MISHMQHSACALGGSCFHGQLQGLPGVIPLQGLTSYSGKASRHGSACLLLVPPHPFMPKLVAPAAGCARRWCLWQRRKCAAFAPWLTTQGWGVQGEGGSGSPLEVLTVSSHTAVAFVCVASGMLLVMFFFLSKAFFYVLVRPHWGLVQNSLPGKVR